MRGKLKLYFDQKDSNLLEEITKDANLIMEQYQGCELNSNLSNILREIGLGFKLASHCFRDVGAIFLILDSFLMNPTEITNYVFSGFWAGNINY